MRKIVLLGGMVFSVACPAKEQAEKSAAVPAAAPAAAAPAAPAPAAAPVDPVAARLAHAQSEEAAGHVKEAAQDYSDLLIDEKTPEAADSRARLALVQLWLTRAEQDAAPCEKPHVKGELTFVPKGVSLRDDVGEHLACLRKRGGEAAPVDRLDKLQARLDGLWTRDAAACKAQKLKAYKKGETGTLLGVMGGAEEAGPCKRARRVESLAWYLGARPAPGGEEAFGLGSLPSIGRRKPPEPEKGPDKAPGKAPAK